MAVKAFAVGGEQVALADAIEEAQAERLLQLGDLPRHGAVLHVQRGSGQRFFFHQRGEVADAAVAAGVPHLIFSTLENVAAISHGDKYAPHFTDKARIADHIRGLPVAHSFIMLAFFYTNLLEYYTPRREGDTLLLPIYLPEDYRAPFVDPLTATGPAVAEILAHPAQYQGQTLPVIGDILSPRDIVATFSRVTGIRAEYRSAYDRDGLLHHFPAFAANELLVQELLGMTSYAVEYGYYRPERDLAWSRRIDPTVFTWEQFLRHSGWRGEAVPFGAVH